MTFIVIVAALVCFYLVRAPDRLHYVPFASCEFALNSTVNEPTLLKTLLRSSPYRRTAGAGVSGGRLIQVMYGLSFQHPRDTWNDHHKQCKTDLCVVYGTSQADLAQIILPFVVGTVLLISWLAEKPRRHFIIFCADNSKSVLAAICTHFMASGYVSALTLS